MPAPEFRVGQAQTINESHTQQRVGGRTSKIWIFPRILFDKDIKGKWRFSDQCVLMLYNFHLIVFLKRSKVQYCPERENDSNFNRT